MSAQVGGSSGGLHLPPVNRITDRCKIITFPQLRLQTVTSQHSSRIRTARMQSVRGGVRGAPIAERPQLDVSTGGEG